MSSSAFAPFKHRAYLLVWLGAMVSNVGTWMETTALSYYVADREVAAWSGIITAVGFLPTALLSPVGGAWADRFDRRKVLICTNLASLVIAAGVAAVVTIGDPTPIVLAGFSLAAGCANAIGFASFQTTLPDLVPPEELAAAIGLGSTQWNLGRIVGPSAAGIAIWLGGVPAALWCNAISFVAVVTAVSMAAIPAAPRTKRAVMAAMRDGIRFAREHPAMRAMVPVMITVCFLATPFIGFVAQMATKVFHGTQTSTSLLITCQGVGAVLAGASIGPLTNRFGVRRTMMFSVSLFGPALVLYGASPNLPVAAVALALTGYASMSSVSTFSTITQQAAPAGLRGRAMSVNNLIMGFAYPLGLFILGPIADATSLRTMTIGSGATLAGALLLFRILRPRHTEPIALALG